MHRFVLLAALLSTGCVRAVDVQGHRGARGVLPENTWAGFTHAIEVGACTLEMDVLTTSDGRLVVHHGTALHPDIAQRDGKWVEGPAPSIYALPLSEIATYDVGELRPDSAYAKRFPEQKSVPGTRVPLLADVIRRAEAQTDNRIRYNIETKLSPDAPHATPAPVDIARALVDRVTAEGIASRTTIQSFDWRTLRAVQRLAPSIATSCLSSEQEGFDTLRRGEEGASPWTAGFDVDEHASVPRFVQAAGCKVWSPDYRDVDAADVQEAHGLGLQVAVWTVNEPADIEAMLDEGVDAIISDYPARVLEVMEREGVPTACPR